MNQILFKLEASDIALYEDMCFGNGMTPRITRITKEQTYFLISLREN